MTSRQRGPKPSESLIDPAHFHKCDYATTNSAAFADPQVSNRKTLSTINSIKPYQRNQLKSPHRNISALSPSQVVYAKTYKEKTMPEMQQDLRAKPLLTGTSCVPPALPHHSSQTPPPPSPHPSDTRLITTAGRASRACPCIMAAAVRHVTLLLQLCARAGQVKEPAGFRKQVCMRNKRA